MIRSVLLAIAGFVSTTSPAAAADWKMEAGTSRLEFAATYERTAAPGVFKEFDTRLHFDADKPTEGRLDVTIVISSADMNSADVNKAIGAAEWFDFAKFPRAEFHATEIRRTAAGRSHVPQRTARLPRPRSEPEFAPRRYRRGECRDCQASECGGRRMANVAAARPPTAPSPQKSRQSRSGG